MLTTPVIVPAAPEDCPLEAEMWLHAIGPAVVDVVAGAEVDVVVLDDVVVADGWCVVVVAWGVPFELQLASTPPAHARRASTQRRGVTPRSPPAAPSRGTGGTGRPAPPGC